MGKKVIHGSVILRDVPSGSGHSNILTYDSSTGIVGTISGVPLTTTLTAGYLFVGNGSNVATATAITGDVTINSSGVTAIASGVIVNGDVHASAAIAHSKMAALTASRALVSDGSGVVSVSSVTSTELGHVSGVTSALQTQIDAKQATVTGAATTIVSSNLTASRALISNGSGKVAVSSVTDTELGYVSGVTSAIQTQLNTKLAATITSVAQGDILYYNGSAWVNLARGTNGQTLRSTATSIQWDTPTINGIPVGGTDGQVLTKQSGTDYDADWETLVVASITDITASAAEINILDGATIDVNELNFLENASANIQSQLDGKLSTSLTTDNILKGVGGVATASTDLPTGITIGGAVIYRVGGSDVTLADGGTGASLADPGADRILFWDDSAGQVTWLTAGAGLTITGTTIDTVSGTIVGSTGSTDNALLRADGTGGVTVQASAVVVDDSGNISVGLSGTAGGTRTITAVGSASDVGISVVGKGVGSIQLQSGTGSNTGILYILGDACSLATGVNQIGGTSGRTLELYNSSAGTNAVRYPLRATVISSGTPANGIGSGIEFVAETSANNNEVGATIEAVTTDVTAASEDFDLVFKTMVAGAAASEHLRFGSNKIGFFGVSTVARQVVPTGSSTDTVITALQNLGLFSQT